ncbi:MAG: GMC family oxidoreductase N-terminal domain-containing protein [Pseudomonadota bacterium]|nr:GMC family oxidoreductase N-terminal domain-containing protein [Pseudomonadota bacterium]
MTLPTWAGARFSHAYSGDWDGRPARLHLTLETGPLLACFDAPPYRVAVVAGSLVRGDETRRIVGGEGVLFESDGADTVRTRLRVTLDDGSALEIVRTLHDDPGWDLPNDLGVDVRLAAADGARGATVRLDTGIFAFLDEVGSATATVPAGEPPADAALDHEVAATLKGFHNVILGRVFTSLPQVFPSDAFLTNRQWALLNGVVRALLPDPLPADGPTLEDTVGRIELLVRHGTGPLLDQLRTSLDVLGVLLPTGLPYGRWLRDWVAKTGKNPDAAEWATLQQLQRTTIFPYYSHPRADTLLGYQRPARSGATGPTLAVHTAIPEELWDLVIVGSGPAGSVLAARLAQPGRKVLVLEAGPYVPEHTLPVDELYSMTRLYKDTAAQMANPDGASRDAAGSISILQGHCVGGGGMINNLICFKLPQYQLDAWRAQGFPFDAPTMARAFEVTGRELGVRPVSEALTGGGKVNPAWEYLSRRFGTPGIIRPEDEPTPGFFQCMVNGEDCVGCGWCGQGCAYGRKRNALHVYLPRAIANGAVLVPEARVVSLQKGDGASVSGLTVQVAGRGEVHVRARNVLLCASAIGTTGVVLNTPWLAEHARKNGLPVGENVSVNAGCVCHALYEKPVHEGGSFQVAFYVLPPDAEAGFVMETWWNPPGMQAMAVPGLQDEHHARMMRYRSMVTFAPLIASVIPGTVRLEHGRPRVDIPMGQPELDRLKAGLRVTLEALLEGSVEGVRPDCVVINSRAGVEVRSMDEVDTFLATLERVEQLNMGTGHPQGGSAISTLPERGVVDADFRMRGVENLWICDASLFPSASGINPQWTIMALAHLCAERVGSVLGRVEGAAPAS